MLKMDSSFIQPNDDNVKIWRYMDLEKFHSIIETSSLFFSRADMFDDKFEGSYPLALKEIRDIMLKAKSPKISPYINSETFKQLKAYVNINCWHMNEYESAAMWRLYIRSEKGIAFQTTYHKLKNEFELSGNEVYLSCVKYIDYSNPLFESGAVSELTPFVLKRKSFLYENELRALTLSYSKGVDLKGNIVGKPPKYGQSVKVNLENLIEKIYIAPNSSKGLIENIKAILNENRQSYEIVMSDLDRDPIF